MENKKIGEWCEITVPEYWTGYTIEHILKEEWKSPRGLLHELRMNKGVKINGEISNWSKEVNVGDQLQIHLFQREDYGVVPNDIPIDILYEDDHLLIVNKPSNMDTHPSDPRQKDSLSNAVAYHLQCNGIETKIRHIHRLDKDTTGAVLFGKHALAGAIMDRLLEKRIIKRTYVALVQGNLKKKSGTICEPIGRDRHHATRRRVSRNGQEAITNYDVLHYDAKKDVSVVKLQLQTGRTHQIRVHMSFIGHPLIGDKLYGGKAFGAHRQALHAAAICLPHPITQKIVSCVAQFIDKPPLFDYDIKKLLD